MKIKILNYLEKNKEKISDIIHGQLEGCTESELHSLISKLNFEIPLAYREFMFLAGQNFFDFFPIGNAGNYRNFGGMLVNMKIYLLKIGIYQGSEIPLTCSDDNFWFIYNNEEDPSVFYINEDSTFAAKQFDKLSDFIAFCVDEY